MFKTGPGIVFFGVALGLSAALADDPVCPRPLTPSPFDADSLRPHQAVLMRVADAGPEPLCPGDPESLEKKRAEWIEKVTEGRSIESVKETKKWLSLCPISLVSKKGGDEGCLYRLKAQVAWLDFQYNSVTNPEDMGFQKYAAGDGLEIPGMMAFPPLLTRNNGEVLSLLSSEDTFLTAYQKIDADPEGKKWTVTRFVAPFAPSASNRAKGRVQILAPSSDGRYVQLFNLAVPHRGVDSDFSKPDKIGFHAIQLRDRQGQPLKRPVSRIFDYDLKQSSQGTSVSSARPTENCLSCHSPSGVIKTQPEEASAIQWAIQSALLNPKVDALHEDFGALQWDGLHEEKPDVGPDDRERPESFIKACLDAVPRKLDEKSPKSTRYGVIAKAMNCASCHDGVSYGPIAKGMLLGRGFALLKRAVVDLRKMPPETDLTPEEREALLICLETEYLGKSTRLVFDGGIPKDDGFMDTTHAKLRKVVVDPGRPGLLGEWLAAVRCEAPSAYGPSGEEFKKWRRGQRGKKGKTTR